MVWHGTVLARFSPPLQEKLLAHGERFRFAAGQTIFAEGSPSLYLYIVRSGQVAIEVDFPAWGRRQVLTVGPGELFSWSALVEPRLETASARALEETEVLGIKGGTLMDLCREDAEFGFQLYRTLAEVITDRLVAARRQLLEGVPWPQEATPSR